ncbi:MAG: hypothetical protein ACJATN_002320 [Neolewinella sp.]|jgi:hypothetical protein
MTVYLVVENKAQKEALRSKQAETLDADPALDLEETDQMRRMSEPWCSGLFVLCGCAGAGLTGIPGCAFVTRGYGGGDSHQPSPPAMKESPSGLIAG